MDYVIAAIFGRRALGQLSSEDYTDWAGEMLVLGYDCPSLRILAGLDKFVSTFEAEDYFLRSVRELDLKLPDPDIASARTPAKSLSEWWTIQSRPKSVSGGCFKSASPRITQATS